MIFAFITTCLIVGTAFLLRYAKNKNSFFWYFLVLIAGLVTFLFEPVAIVLLTDRSSDGGAIQIVSTVFGIFCIGWSILKIIKNKNSLSFKEFRGWIFREDLDLKKRWWHRLFSVIFIISFFCVAYYVTSWNLSYNKQYERKEPVSKLFSNSMQLLSSISERSGYYISDITPPFRDENDFSFDLYKKNTYCSNRISKQDFDWILKNNSKISDLYVRDNNGPRLKVSVDIFSSYLDKNNIQCVTVDSFTGTNYETVYFLEPFTDIQKYFYYKPSPVKNGLEVISSLGLTLLGFLLVAMFYYKVILYVIFGAKKN